MARRAKSSQYVQAIKRVIKKLKDPAYFAKMQTEIEHSCTLKENEYDATGLLPWSVGDTVMYGMEPDYPERVHESYYLGMYSRHGNGD